jgi:hypothetical protein
MKPRVEDSRIIHAGRRACDEEIQVLEAYEGVDEVDPPGFIGLQDVSFGVHRHKSEWS